MEAVIKILAEIAARDGIAKVGLGRRDDAQVHRLGRRGADRLHLALLDHAQQLRLHRRVHRVDLVEEQRAAMCAADASRPAAPARSEEHTSELQSLMRLSYALFCLTKKNQTTRY